MIRLLRKNFLKSIFGGLLLGIFMLKFLSISIASFSSLSHTYSIEKSVEENQDKEEESHDAVKKKLLLYQSALTVNEHSLWVHYPATRTRAYRERIGSFPPKNVPTPPPDAPFFAEVKS